VFLLVSHFLNSKLLKSIPGVLGFGVWGLGFCCQLFISDRRLLRCGPNAVFVDVIGY